MSAVAKRFLRDQVDGPFMILPKDGGTVGSLVGLGFVEREIRKGKPSIFYHITDKGRLWVGKGLVR